MKKHAAGMEAIVDRHSQTRAALEQARTNCMRLGGAIAAGAAARAAEGTGSGEGDEAEPLAPDAEAGEPPARDRPEPRQSALGQSALGQPPMPAMPAGATSIEERADAHGLWPDLLASWDIRGRDEQKPPAGDWRTWLLIGGRGSGKTRAGAEWVHGLASSSERSELRIALVAETLGDAREVMIDGVSGICRIARNRRPEFEISRRRLIWPNGAVAQIFSSEDPESLRGPQFHYAWCDELAKWKHGEETFDMLQFGLRLGAAPRQLVTTTPRPVPLLKRLMVDPATALTRISTLENRKNLAPGFFDALSTRYGGTRLGRQELDGELIEDREDGLWKREAIEAATIRFTGALRRVVVAVDPPATAGPKSCCGIVVAGIEASGRGVVLADCSVEGASPAGWAGAVAKAYRRFAADRIVAEINQGGDMVSAMLRSIDADLPVTTVRATRGKFLRAEPVAALYEQGRVAHAGRFAALEDQMCDFGPEGLTSGRSPDRLDALVWALTALMLDVNSEPRVRGV
ncbi:terminase family protein [Rhizobium sp. BK251]|uniref:DNA-packaging protein n=1 Tax=Rhizobium sp. BK251 TaxID=2512125 RepID=UPI0010DD86CB|nr:terminase family protein [Rhizobium sp. BK251]TCL76161.1 phage terminase large subunit-like protein [Rhizobium sp. BK251]